LIIKTATYQPITGFVISRSEVRFLSPASIKTRAYLNLFRRAAS
jgi:hypothetical protein